MRAHEKLRLLVISQNFPQRKLEWAGQFMLRQARALREHGDIETSFIVPRPWTPWPLYLHPRWSLYGPENPLLDVSDFEFTRVLFPRPPGASVARLEGALMKPPVVRAARRLHSRTPFDLVMGVQMNGEAISAVEVGRLLGIPAVAMAIGSDIMVQPESVKGLREIQSRMLGELDLPIAVSGEIARRIVEMSPGCTPPFVARLARSADQFHPAPDRAAVRAAHGFDPDDVVAAYVGRIDEAKGMGDLLEVLPALLSEFGNLKFALLGDGGHADRLREAGNRVRPGAVSTPGRVDSEKVPGYLQAADVFVFPSHSEGLPQAVLEAMNCGLPVIATDVGGTPEAVIDSSTGLLVPPHEPEKLATAIRRLVADRDLRLRMGEAGLRHVLAEFDPVTHAKALAGRLRALVAR